MSRRRAGEKSSQAETAAPPRRSGSALKLLTHIPSGGYGPESAASWQEAGVAQMARDPGREAMAPGDDTAARGNGADQGDVLVADRRERPGPSASSGIRPIIRLGISAFRGTRGTVAAIRQAIADARTEIEREAAEPAARAAAALAPPPPAAEPEEAPARPGLTGIARDVEPPLEARARGRPPRREAPDPAPPVDRPAAAAPPPDAAPEQEQPAAPPPPRRIALWEVVALLVLPVAVAALGAFATASLSDPVYAARSEIVFDLRRLDWSGAERYLETQKVVVSGRTLLAPIAETFDLPVLELERDLRVEKVGDSGVLRLQYRHPDPTLAQAVTKAITDRYLLVLREFERPDATSHRLLTPTFVLEQPVAPQPLRAAAIGAVLGLALAAAGVVLRSHAWPAG
jgi:capsular polysaccharide biosynthesis protein